MPRLAVLLLLLGLFPAKATDSSGCIQDAKRQQACPHLLYRAAQLPGMTAAAVVCICVTDFAPLLQAPATETARIQQNMAKRQLEAQHGEKLQSILDMLNRKQ
ncbi:hypothetical protein [Rheinheimera pleomorphica]|uniref:hypothetical protein n=1 Tax=Rheinheimera pleomorphica TaxID=2703963 RepID=UPI00142396E2|nr:hypothetical protein [Rheinheimera pleomorphica]